MLNSYGFTQTIVFTIIRTGNDIICYLGAYSFLENIFHKGLLVQGS